MDGDMPKLEKDNGAASQQEGILPDNDLDGPSASCTSESDSESSTDYESDSSDEELYLKNGHGDCSETHSLAECLFCDFTSQDPEIILVEHTKLVHEFDFKDFCSRQNVSQTSYFCFINYCRSAIKSKDSLDHNQIQKVLKDLELSWNSVVTDEKYMLPVLEDDGLLQYYLDENEMALDQDQFNENEDKVKATEHGDPTTTNVELREKIEEYERMIKTMQEVMKHLIEDGPSKAPSASKVPGKASDDYNRWYFESYDAVEIHSAMLNDKPRTEAYMHSILKNKSDFDSKTVLDLGCGTGILSMFCATAGANRVFAVDNSDIIIEAMDIIQENGFSNTIKCLSGAIEELQDLKDTKVDILVSEWMGYFLLFEGMLSSYLYARDNILKKDGLMFPNTAAIYLVAAEDLESYGSAYEMWDNVYGYKMSTMKKKVLCEPKIAQISNEKVVTNSFELLSLDLTKCSLEDAIIRNKEFTLEATRDCTITSLVGYFDVGFTMGSNYSHVLQTSPAQEPTHWNQCIFLLPKTISILKGVAMSGQFSCEPSEENPRWLTIKICMEGKRYYYELR